MSSTVLRNAARAVSRNSARSFATSAPARRDLVQDLYIKELKGYKAPPATKDAHVGSVKQFSTPSAPKPPSLPSDLASELAAYDAADPVRAPKEGAQDGGVLNAGAEEFLQFLEADVVEENHHH